MFLRALTVVILIASTFFLVVAAFIIADFYGLVDKLSAWWGAWWDSVVCYFSTTFSSPQVTEAAPLIWAAILIIAGLIGIRLALSMQRTAQKK